MVKGQLELNDYNITHKDSFTSRGENYSSLSKSYFVLWSFKSEKITLMM